MLSKPVFPTTTISVLGKVRWFSRKLSLISRLTLLRSEAFFTRFLGTVIPIRACPRELCRANRVSCGETEGMAFWKTFSKWEGDNSLSSRENEFSPTLINYADKRARPLARRLARTLRPFLVAIRARKPWERLRFKLLG